MEFSKRFADYVTNLQLDDIAKEERETAKLSILDFLGVALAGVSEPPTAYCGVDCQAALSMRPA